MALCVSGIAGPLKGPLSGEIAHLIFCAARTGAARYAFAMNGPRRSKCVRSESVCGRSLTNVADHLPVFEMDLHAGDSLSRRMPSMQAFKWPCAFKRRSRLIGKVHWNFAPMVLCSGKSAPSEDDHGRFLVWILGFR